MQNAIIVILFSQYILFQFKPELVVLISVMSSIVNDFHIFIYYVVDGIYTNHPMCLDALLLVFCSILYSDNTDMVSVYNQYTKSLQSYI